MHLNPLRLLCLLTGVILAAPIWACGWWGDGEASISLNPQSVLTIDAGGNVVGVDGPTRQPPEAMLQIGDRFRTGSGGVRDDRMAVHWYRQAARQGFVPAQYNLAMMYERGRGVERDFGRAAMWYRRAATLGDVHAQHHLGEMYQQGRGVTRDPGEALRWIKRAAEQGHAELFADLAAAYWQGKGTEPNPFQAYLWWRLAVLHGEGGGDQSNQARARLTTEQAADAQRQVRMRMARWR